MELKPDSVLEVDEESFAEAFGLAGLDELHREMRFGCHARAVVQHFEQERACQKLHGGGAGASVRPIEDLGTPELQVTEFAFHYWGQRLGYDCWDDPEFIREFGRDNEACRVNCRSERTIITPGAEFKPTGPVVLATR